MSSWKNTNTFDHCNHQLFATSKKSLFISLKISFYLHLSWILVFTRTLMWCSGQSFLLWRLRLTLSSHSLSNINISTIAATKQLHSQRCEILKKRTNFRSLRHAEKGQWNVKVKGVKYSKRGQTFEVYDMQRRDNGMLKSKVWNTQK